MVETKRKKRYTDEDQAAAVEMYLSGPNSMRAVAHALGIECQHPEPVDPAIPRQPSGG